MCVSFILRRLQPLVGEKHVSDQSYKVCFRPDKSELKDLYWEIEAARDFLWCIDMIYKSTLPAMNINSISLAPHAAGRAAENQDRRKWVSWLKEIEREAVKGHVLDFDQNDYCTYNEKERELERYPEDFAVGADGLRSLCTTGLECNLKAQCWMMHQATSRVFCRKRAQELQCLDAWCCASIWQPRV